MKIFGKTFGKTTEEILWTVLGVPIGFALSLVLIGWAAHLHAAAGAAAALVFCVGTVVYGLWDMTSIQARKYPALQGLRIFLLIILVGAAVFGEISRDLAVVGWAKYEPEGGNFLEFTGYYIITFLDVIPGLDILGTLGIKQPFEPDGFVAGLPIVAYRALLIYGVFLTCKAWWDNRHK